MKTREISLEKQIFKLVKPIRTKLDKKHKGDRLYGECVKASELVKKALTKAGIKCKIVKGWCIYDDSRSCSDRDYDEHTWVEVSKTNLIVDITLDQFEFYIYDQIPKIFIAELPRFLEYSKPR